MSPPRPADHRPADHRPADHRPADHRPADHRPADHRPADHRPASLYDRVTAGPTCPVERVDQPCPPRAVSADVVVRDATDGRTVATARTDADAGGEYAVSVPAGRYMVEALTGAAFPPGRGCQPVQVTVEPGPPTRS